MAKLEWPADDGDDVQHCTRPKNKNHEQSSDDIEPEEKLALGNYGVCVLYQHRQRYALNDADERELDLDHH